MVQKCGFCCVSTAVLRENLCGCKEKSIMSKSILTRRIQAVSPSITLAITSKAKVMVKQGIDVVSFGAGEPDFDTPEHIKAAAKKALDDGFTKYTPASGTMELKQAVCKKLKNENGLDYQPANIVISCGAKHSLYNVIQVICEEGDEIIISAPYWVSYPAMTKLAGGKPVIVDTTEKNRFCLQPQQLKNAITKKTKAIVINSPGNPTGSMYSRADLEQIAAVAGEHDLLIISDEIYEKIVYDGKTAASIASFSEEIKKRTIVVNGFSGSRRGRPLRGLSAIGSIARMSFSALSKATWSVSASMTVLYTNNYNRSSLRLTRSL